jgi:hypothetical protein
MEDKGKPYELAHIAPFLMLPRLKTLIAENVTTYIISNEKPTIFEPPECLENSVLERLVLFHADIDPESLQKLLDLIKSLRVFILEDSFPRYSSLRPINRSYRYEESLADDDEYKKNRAGDDRYKDGESHGWEESSFELEIPRQLGRTYANESFEADFEEGDFYDQFPTGTSFWLRHYRAEDVRFWDPSELLHQISLRYGDTLEHLALTKSGNPASVDFKRKGHVLHFLDFKKLTTLEIDIQIRRPRMKSIHCFAPAGIPASLASILPPTIEVVRIVTSQPCSKAFLGLLDGVAQEIARFPSLHRIRLIVNRNWHEDNEVYDAEWIEEKVCRKIGYLIEELSQVVVALEVKLFVSIILQRIYDQIWAK